MKALLDTQALIWFGKGDTRMPQRVRRFIASERNELVLSMVTAWEITIKANLGKLQLEQSPAAYISRYMGELSLVPLSISFDHIFELSNLPLHHGDPFDRLLIAQSRKENIPLISGDGAIQQYDVKTIW